MIEQSDVIDVDIEKVQYRRLERQLVLICRFEIHIEDAILFVVYNVRQNCDRRNRTRSKLQIYSTRSSYLCGLIFLAKNLEQRDDVSQKTGSYFVDN